ncbi:DoxX-like family protein [Actinokineospora alba]|uniref:DoxX-like family protein n=1 Tax=Actinokineospora alba TaxID=504798 RepID=A0A1H0FSD4_9PSEU|nr:DoxX family protein [Actinokineospora alba]TDP69597.1 DoxX-like protein [Actinokineospora alba]SDI13333.1 DoxX-like family protein [Actinokineospora alba]SDN97588.1 DoxX-like family protein [Actinokineospora alba]
MIVIAAIIAVTFGGLGLAKLLALAPMRVLAAKAGFSVAAYRAVGALEVAGAVGVALGPVVPLLGIAAACGLLLLLGGALTVHLRRGDGAREVAPAVVCGVLVACYATVLSGAL